MKFTHLFALSLTIALLGGEVFGQSASLTSKSKDAVAAPVSFATPVPVKINGTAIRVESPGYASPCVGDVTGDGRPDLLVGQFNEGRIRVYPGLEKGGFGPGDWLMADGKVVSVPGVW